MTDLYKSIITVAAVCMTAGTISARHLTPDDALARVYNSTQVNPRIKKAANKVRLVHTMTSGTVPTVYVYNQRANKGFLILSADDTAPAILGYSDTGTINPDNLPPGLDEWMNNLSADIGYVASNPRNLRTSPSPGNAWDDIGPMLTTTWDQGDPYNTLCPWTKNYDTKCPTGCAATAMAQIMNFYEWPKQGVGEKSYIVANKRKKLTANFSETTYDWSHMADHYGMKDLSYNEDEGVWYADKVENSAEEKNAVSTLMFHLGVAASMEYRDSESTTTADVYVTSGAMVDYFDYDPSLSFVYRDKEYEGNDDGWEALVYNELAEGRPVFYTGHSSMGGHAFVCDGYKKEIGADGNTRNYFHINWGWSGMGDGYYLVTAFYSNDGTPLCPPESVTGWSSMHFADNQGIIVGLRPNKAHYTTHVQKDTEYVYSDGTPSLQDADGNTITEPVAGETYNLCLPMVNGCTRTVTYYFGVELYNKEAETSKYVMSPTPQTLKPGENLSYIEITWPTNSANGDYDIIPCYATSPDATTMTRVELPEEATMPEVVNNNGFDLVAGQSFDLDVDCEFPSITYHRPLYSGVWNSWYLPFAINTDELADNHLTAACVNGVHQYDDDGDGFYERTEIELLTIKNGTLRPSTPYFVKPDAEYDGMVQLGARTVTKASTMHNVHTETAYAMYDFIGTYTKKNDGNEEKCYIMAKDGSLKITSSYVPAVFWYMQITPKESPFDDYTPVSAASSKVVITTVGEEDAATGIKTFYEKESPKRTSEVVYNLRGESVSNGYKGIVIKNGKKIMMR